MMREPFDHEPDDKLMQREKNIHYAERCESEAQRWIDELFELNEQARIARICGENLSRIARR